MTENSKEEETNLKVRKAPRSSLIAYVFLSHLFNVPST